MKKSIFDLDEMEEFIKHFILEMQSVGYSAWYISRILAFVLYSIDFDIE